MDTLYTQILPLEKDLNDDDDALNWFNLCMAVTPPVPEPSEIPSTPLAGASVFHKKFLG